MAQNRRQHPRVRARSTIAHLRAQGRRTSCQVENISMGGLFVRTDRHFDVNTEVMVELTRAGWKQPLTVPATVTSSLDGLIASKSGRVPGMGLRFGRLDGEALVRLSQLLDDLGGAPKDPGQAPDPLPPAEEAPRPTVVQPLELDLGTNGERLQTTAVAIDPSLEQPEDGTDLLRPLLPEEISSPPPAAAQPRDQRARDDPKMMVQIRGLLMEVNELQNRMHDRDLEIERLREELEVARTALGRALSKPS